jgi:hypothetical protein
MKKTLLISFNCLLALICISNKSSAQPNNNQKQSIAPDWYQEALKTNKENSHLIEANFFKFDTTDVKQKEIDFSQDNAQTYLKLYMLKEQQNGDTTKRFGIKVTQADIPRK